ncbi:MAG: hypothetical protein NTY96_07310 [Bacteroidetes bacterium]|nr:hypothetical protein [Bacteroidota bacterium]
MKRKEFEVIIDKSGNDKLRVRISTIKGDLIDVMFQYESLINNKWVPIVRYDCNHGFFHRDVLQPNGGKEKTEIAIDSLKTASNYAEQDLKDRWEWYKERYIKKLKTKKPND